MITASASMPLYDRDIFWAEAAIGVTLFLALLKYLSKRRADRRKRLEYCLLATTPLLDQWPGLEDAQLSVLLNGEPLHNPHVSVLHVYNRSCRDIASSDFEGKPLIFGFGSEIVYVADMDSNFDYDSTVRVTDTAIEVGPVLVGPYEHLRLTVLTKEQPQVSCRGRLLGADIRHVELEAVMGSGEQIVPMVIMGLFCVAAGALSLANPHWVTQFNLEMSQATWTAGLAFAAAAIFLAVSAWRFRRRLGA
jgi:hypothetical protein